MAFQALRELQFMQIFLISVLASASGNLAIGSPAEREREIPYLTLTAPDRRNAPHDSSSMSAKSSAVHFFMNRSNKYKSGRMTGGMGFRLSPAGHIKLLAAVIIFPVLAVMFLTLSDGTVAEQDDGSRILFDEQRQMTYWRPGETKTMPLRVKNEGMIEDSYCATLVISNPTWSGHLDSYLFLNVTTGEVRLFNLSITAPFSFEGDFTKANVTLWSMRSDKYDRIIFTAFLIWAREVEIVYDGPPSKDLTEGTTASWTVTVQNKGDYQTAYELTAKVMDGEEKLELGYEVTMEVEVFHLDRGEETEVKVMLTITDETAFAIGQAYHLIVWVNDEDDPRVWAMVRLTWTIPLRYDAWVRPSNTTFEPPPGGTVNLTIRVHQDTNDDLGHIWNVHIGNLSDDWDVVVDRKLLTLTGIDSADVGVQVTAPPKAGPGTTMELSIELENVREPGSSSVVHTRFVVPEIRDFTMRREGFRSPIEPAETRFLDVRLLNAGNVPEDYRFTAYAVRMQNTSYKPFGTYTSNGTLNPGNARIITRVLHFNEQMPWGDYELRLECVLERGGVLTDTHTYYITERPEVEIIGLPEDRLVIDPNLGIVKVPILVKNSGNIRQTLEYSFNPQVAPRYIDIHLEELEPGEVFYLDIGEVRFLTLNMTAMAPDRSDERSITIVFHDPLWENSWKGWFRYDIIGPDLEITKVDVPKRVVPGSMVDIMVTVTNWGGATSMPTRLIIEDRLTGDIVSEARLPPIRPGQEWSIGMELLTESEHGKMYIHLDPEDTVKEVGNEVNVWVFNIEMTEQTYRGPSYLSLTVLAVVAMGAVIALMRKRGLAST